MHCSVIISVLFSPKHVFALWGPDSYMTGNLFLGVAVQVDLTACPFLEDLLPSGSEKLPSTIVRTGATLQQHSFPNKSVSVKIITFASPG